MNFHEKQNRSCTVVIMLWAKKELLIIYFSVFHESQTEVAKVVMLTVSCNWLRVVIIYSVS